MALVSAIVATSGGAQSIFVPLYVLTVVAASFVLSRAGALAVAGLSSVFYVAVVLGPDALASLGGVSGGDTTTDEALAICLNAAVFLVVGFVTSSLAGRYRESQAHLDAHRKHLSDLQAFRDLIFESVGSGLVGVDPRGRVTAFNRAAESITGFRSADALGQPWGAIFGSGVDLDEVRETADEDQSPPRALRVPAPPAGRARQVPVGISFWSLRSGDGEVAGLIGVCQDLSAIKQMEQRMRQADRLATVGRLSANMAHEIRNPARVDLGGRRGARQGPASRRRAEPARRDRPEGVGAAQPHRRSIPRLRAPRPAHPHRRSTSPRSSTRSCS